MNVFRKLAGRYKQYHTTTTSIQTEEKQKNIKSSADCFDIPDNFSNIVSGGPQDAFVCNAWVTISIDILIRNVARASFVLRRDGNAVTTGPLYDLFRRPNPSLNRYDLWKETAGYWFLTGEAFWWFGPDYSGGLPKELFILDPRRIRREDYKHGLSGQSADTLFSGKRGRWFYQTDFESVPMLQDELVHFKNWNPLDPLRGVSPLLALGTELEQDYYANKANSQLLKHNSVPQGILKTDQTIRPEEADALERRWESKYGAARANRKIAVLGKGTTFEPLSFSPEVVKLFELKRWIVYTVLAKYGIPARVAGISDKSTALSGTDTGEQHGAFWKYTLIPLLKQFEHILEAQFFMRLGLREEGIFNLADIPELQQSEDEQSNRDIAEINAGLKTINDVLRERGKEPKPWGDMWYRPKNLVPYKQQTHEGE